MLNGDQNSADEFQKHELSNKLLKKTYLIIYSRANESILPDRQCITTSASSLIITKDRVIQENIYFASILLYL